MKHKKYMEIKQGRKHYIDGLAEKPPDPRASERFRAPAYQAGRMILAQGMQTQNRTFRELLDYLWDGFSSGRMCGAQPVSEDVVEYIHGGHLDVAEYLANKYDIKRG